MNEFINTTDIPSSLTTNNDNQIIDNTALVGGTGALTGGFPFNEYVLKQNPHNRAVFSVDFGLVNSTTSLRISADFFPFKTTKRTKYIFIKRIFYVVKYYLCIIYYISDNVNCCTI
eukprot:UN03477